MIKSKTVIAGSAAQTEEPGKIAQLDYCHVGKTMGSTLKFVFSHNFARRLVRAKLTKR